MSVTRLRAPSGDGSVLCVPDWDTWPELVAKNRRLQDSWQIDILGRPLSDLRRQARKELLSVAEHYTFQYRPIHAIRAKLTLDSEQPFVLGGHQPELFHPGVWLKNFALAELAKEVSGVAINLAIDADAFKTNELPVPVRNGDVIQRQLVPFDLPTAPTVHEERTVVDSSLFNSFGERVCELLHPNVTNPWLREIWPRIIKRANVTGHIGTAFAQVRHQIEGELGSQTLEVPQSEFCKLPVFYHFVAHLIAERHRFREVYNRAILDYRQQHHLRSASHPAPELRQDGIWTELPFWSSMPGYINRPITTSIGKVAESPEAIDREGSSRLLFGKEGFWNSLPDPTKNLESCAIALGGFEETGLKLRTKALATTLFARVFLGDLFVHGLGGGMYDQVTDQIIRDFYGIEPPRYVIATGTLRLPIPRSGITAHDVEQHTMRLWAMIHHPETFLDYPSVSPEVRELINQKRHWISITPTKESSAERCRAIRAINVKLGESLAINRQQWIVEHQQLESQLEVDQVLGSREYPWPWYPRETLEKFLLAFRSQRP
jgi:hypothetical protein